MKKSPLKTVWQGRIDKEDASGRRWHQQMHCIDDVALLESFDHHPVIVGFACDKGVRRNQGRIGAKDGPAAIRSCLANLACSELSRFYDVGDVCCDDENLELAQQTLSDEITTILQKKGFPIILGGGHEVGWASFLGAQQYLALSNSSIAPTNMSSCKLGIINLDAHFDLRNPAIHASSGTPFRQCHEYAQQNNLPFSYSVLGINPSVNTRPLFDYAEQASVTWRTDEALFRMDEEAIFKVLQDIITPLDYVYLTVCLDVFSQCFAPGVSAPSAVGIPPHLGIFIIKTIRQLCAELNVQLLLCDIAEMNPRFDVDAQTAKLAARLVYEMTV